MKEKVLKTITLYELLNGKTSIVLGLSGGPDSMSLLYSLNELALEYIKTKGKHGIPCKIYPVHINHMLRGVDADNDEKTCIKVCKELSKGGVVMPCTSFKFDCNRIAKDLGISSEEAGRKVRYESFLKVAHTLDNPVICVAQNADDQAETILFRMIRGTGMSGLTGIAFKRYEEDVPVIRPLLNITRTEIMEYLKKNDIMYCVDKTNSEAIYTRNKIRLNVLPMLKEINPNIVNTINRMGENLNIDKDYLDSIASEELTKVIATPEKIDGVKSEIALDIKALDNLHKAIRIRIYTMVLKALGMDDNLGAKGIDSIDSIRTSLNHKMAICELSGGYRVCRIKQKIIFYFVEKK